MKNIVAGTAALLSAVTMLASSETIAQQSITVSSWGGAFQKAQREAWFNLVEKELGITIKAVSYTHLTLPTILLV